MSMDFYELPLVGSLSQAAIRAHGVLAAESTAGSPISFQWYLGGLGGQVYLGLVESGYYGLSLQGNVSLVYTITNISTEAFERPVEESSIPDIYCSTTPTVMANTRKLISITSFSSIQDMVEAFNEQYGNPDVNAVIVSVSGNIPDGADSGGTSGPDSGSSPDEGGYDDSSDIVPLSSLPNISVASTGMVSLFNPTQAELNALGAYLWTDVTDVPQNINKWLMNPLDFLIALNIIPVLPAGGTAVPIKIGSFTTNIVMPRLPTQWEEFTCGTVEIPEYWGSYMDYSPYTRIHAFLPFIGAVQLNTDEVMSRSLTLKYRIDLLSGDCVASIIVADTVLYQYTGNCAIKVPLTGADWSRIYGAAGGIAGSIMAGIGGGIVAQTAANNASYNLIMAKNAAAANSARAAIRTANAAETASALNMGGGIVSNVMGAKGVIGHTGALSSSISLAGLRTPYIMLEYPHQSLPAEYKKFVGYPSNIRTALSGVTGYTVCEQVIAYAPTEASGQELGEIISLLKGGVYL